MAYDPSSSPTQPMAANDFVYRQLSSFMASDSMRIQQANAESAQAITSMLAPLFTGGRELAQLRSSANLMDRIIASSLPIGGAALAEMAGYGAGAAFGAAQNMFSYGGMTLQGPGGVMPMNGYGLGAEMLSNQLWSMMKPSVFTPTGAANLQQTYGLSPQDVGMTLQELSRRGSFAGMNAGTMETLTATRIAELKQQAASTGNSQMASDLQQLNPGDFYVAADPGLMGKVNKWKDDALRTVNELKQVFGDLQPSVLLGELEKLTGVDVGRPGQMRAGMQALSRSIITGAAEGMSPTEALEFRAASTSTLDSMLSSRAGLPSGSFYRSAAAMASIVDETALPAYREHRAGGGFRTKGEIATRKAADMATMLQNNPELVESMYAAAVMGDTDGGRALAEGIDAFAGAGTEAARQQSRLNQAALLRQHFGARSGSLINTLGRDSMMEFVALNRPDLLERVGGAVGAADQASMVGDFRQFLGMMTPGAARAFGGLDNGARVLHGLFSGLDPSQRQMMLDGNYTGLAGVQIPGLGDAGGLLGNLAGNMGGAQLGHLLRNINAAVLTSPNTSALLSGPGAVAASRARTSETIEGISNRGRSPMSVTQKILQTALGGDLPETDQVMLDFARGAEEGKTGSLISRYKINGGLGLDVTEAQAKELAGQLAASGENLYRMFGIDPKAKDAGTQLAKALGQSGALGKVANGLGRDPSQIIGISDKDGSAGLEIARDPSKLREKYNNELAEIRGEPITQKAAAAADKSVAAAAQSGTLNLTVHAPEGIFRMPGTYDIKR